MPLEIVSRPGSVEGRLTAHDEAGATHYQVDGPYRDGYRLLGLREGITGVGSLGEARLLMRADYASKVAEDIRPAPNPQDAPRACSIRTPVAPMDGIGPTRETIRHARGL
ncbi:MAG: hypothetical protein OXG35_14810 [Acidobacteria bacterium]|nr:hypothetical protein [Acidobacteriota bacterium]